MLALWEYYWSNWVSPFGPIPSPVLSTPLSNNGIGYRSVWSMMIEMSFHLVEPIVFTALTSTIPSSGAASPTVGSMGIPVNAIYIGAQLVIDPGMTNQEIVTVTAFNPATNSFTSSFIFPHAVGSIVVGATFPTQAASGDPFFTQSEIQSYIARAQNNFLADVPCIFGANTQTVQFGQIYQQLACDAIEFHHASSSAMNIAITSLTRSGGVVVAVSVSPHGLIQGQKFSMANIPDPSFNGGFTVASILNPTSWSYIQDQQDAVVAGGTAVLWKRLYFTSQEELSIQNPFWRNQNITEIRAVYEDRCGNYRFGVDGKPSTNLPLSVLVSVRGPDTLSMTDYFIVPDIILHAVKYLSLSWAWSKDGEQRSPLLEKYAKMRYDRLVLAVRRWMDGSGIDTGVQKAAIRG